jgi:hypothetical protein
MGYLYRPKLKDWRTRPVEEQRAATTGSCIQRRRSGGK